MSSAERRSERGVQSGAVRADQARSRARGVVDQGAGEAPRRSPPCCPPGARLGGAAVQALAAEPPGTETRPVSGPDRGVAEGRPGGAAQAAPYRQTDLAAPGRRARRRGLRAPGLPLRGHQAARDRRGRGLRAADLRGGRRGRGRLGRGAGDHARRASGGAPVPDARLPFGRLLCDRLRVRDPAGVPGGPRRRPGVLRRSLRADPLRQPEGGRGEGDEGPPPGGVRPLRRSALPLRLRFLLLPER